MTNKAKEVIEKELEEKTGNLNLNDCDLDWIPEEVGRMTWLTELDLSSNRISKIECLNDLSSLTKLWLYKNQINKLEGLQGLSNLTVLSLFENHISKLEGLNGLSQLKELDLSGNEVRKIEGLEGLTDLTLLYLHSNQIGKLEGLEGLSSLSKLHLQKNQIGKLEGLGGLSILTELFLHDNQIGKLEGLEGLPDLTELSLGSNQINKLEGLEGLSSLTTLWLYSNQINKLEGLEGLSDLTELYLYSNQIGKLEGLNGLSCLSTLHLQENQISKLEGLEDLPGLTELWLHKNHISKLEGLEGLSCLMELNLSGNQISKLEGLEGLPDLIELSLGSNQLNKLEGLEGLSTLTELFLHDNQISKLEGLEGLSSLTNLDLSGNQISKLEGLESLSSITNLDLSDNQISKLEGLEGLSRIKVLFFQNNQISKLEGLEGLSTLTELFLHDNQISKLEGLEDLSSLTMLYLENNQIKKLEGLEGLSSLNALFIQNNQINRIEGLLTLSNLKILDFENNLISELPTEYKVFLNSLLFLDLKGTKIESLSFFYKSIEQGKRILWEDIEQSEGEAPNKRDYFEFTFDNNIFHLKKGINVKGCTELESGLVVAIQTGPEALLDYIREPRERLFEARVLVLGEPRAGKTTLRRKLLNVGSTMPTLQESTQAFEIEIEPYVCDIELGEKKEKLRCYLWDFGGQDYYRLLHQLFVAEQSVYIIVVGTDRNRSEEELEFWLDTIERLGKDERQRYGPVILLQNPKNNRAGGIFTDIKSRYPFWQQTEDFVINLNALNNKEDSFDRKELNTFRRFEKYLSRSFCQLDYVGKEIPVKWIAVREALLKEKGNWISIERFNDLCIKNEIIDKEQRSNLLAIFRQLGYILHYKNTALRGMVILNKEWVTDALYRVLDDPIVDGNKGWFEKEDVEKIWYEEKYENRTEELLALMQEFKLCYQNRTTNKFIVPSKLPNSTDNLPIWDATNNVRLRLQYDWMPKALVIQLLVSLHEYIVPLEDGKHWIWRKGAVLEGKQLDLEGVQVRIKDEYDKERIAIDARGAHSEDVIRIIMKKWREVNEPFKDKVEVTSIILCPCSTCSELKRPTNFDYEDVLRAKEKGKPQYCNKSFESLAASDILQGVYDETTILIDSHSLKTKKKKNPRVLDLIRADDLDKAIEAISAPDYNVLFARRLEQWKRNSRLGSLSFEQKTQSRNALAQDLVDYFTSDRWQQQRKLERLGEMLPSDMEVFTSDSNRKNKGIDEAIPIIGKDSPPVKVNINPPPTQESPIKKEPVRKVPTLQNEKEFSESKPIYQQWWFGRIVGAILGGGVIGYFANKYGNFHFGDTWLGLTSFGSTILLLRNPKRAYLRWAGFCVMAISGINILSQIDVAFNITDTTEETRPWELLFKLGFGEEPIVSILLGVLAIVLFVLDYRVRKDNL